MSELRELREADAEQVAALFVEAFGDARPLDAEEISSWLRNEELQAELMRVLEEDGRVVGYGDLWIDRDAIELDVAAPGHWEILLDWAEQTARERGLRSVRVGFPVRHQLEPIVARRGYRLARSSYAMEIELAVPPAPSVPPGIEVRAYRAGVDEAGVRAAVDEAFAQDPHFTPPTESYFREFYVKARGFDPSLWLVAWDAEEIAGVVLAYSDRMGDDTIGWIGTLGVRSPWRRRGLGEALLRSAFVALHGHGRQRVGLGVDADNATGALGLYERAGMRVVRQTDTWVLERG